MPQLTHDFACLPMDASLEAFFVAVALEMGTPPGMAQYVRLPQPRPPDLRASGAGDAAWSAAAHFVRVKQFMATHPGAPPVIQKLRRAHFEMGGAAHDKTGIGGEERYWMQLMESYISWISAQCVP